MLNTTKQGFKTFWKSLTLCCLAPVLLYAVINVKVLDVEYYVMSWELMHHIVLPSSRYVIHCVLTTIQDSTLTEERRGQSQHSYITNKLSFPQNKNLYCTGGEESEPKLAAKNTNLQVSPVWFNIFWLAWCRLQETLKWLFSSLRIVTAQFGLMRYLYLKLWCRSSVKCADRLAGILD